MTEPDYERPTDETPPLTQDELVPPEDEADEVQAEVEDPNQLSLIAPDDAAEEIAMLREHDEKIRKLADECAALEEHWEGLKSAAKDAKDTLDERLKELRRECQSRPEPPPLFAGVNKNTGEVVCDDAPVAVSPVATSDDWKAVTLADAGIDPKLVAILGQNEPPLRTLGELTEFLGDGRSELTDVAGIGPTKAKQIEDSLAAYWSAHKPPVDGGASQEDGQPSATPPAPDASGEAWRAKPLEGLIPDLVFVEIRSRLDGNLQPNVGAFIQLLDQAGVTAFADSLLASGCSKDDIDAALVAVFNAMPY